MHTGRRGFIAAALAVAAISLPAQAGLAKPAHRGAVTVRQGQWVGLQMDIAGVQTGGRFVVRPAQANGSVTSLQPVVQICRQCAVGINGDFFDSVTRQPIGGVIVDHVVLRSPNPGQNQLTFGPDGRISAGPMRWLGALSSGNLTMPVAVNDPRATTPVLYDGHFGSTTPPGPGMELTFVPHPSALYLGRAVHLAPRGPHAPGSAIPPGAVVLRAPREFVPQMHELQTHLRAHKQATLHLATDPMAKNSLGANHILLRGGRIQPIGEDDAFVNSGNPRTLFGWDARGRVTLVTIGSAVPGRRAGVSLPIAARLIQSLGVTNAVNLDGGGSSTFVSSGRILNHPSDGSARAVANAWVVLPRPRHHAVHARARVRRRLAVVHTRRSRPKARPKPAPPRRAPARVTPPATTPVAAVPAHPSPTTTTPRRVTPIAAHATVLRILPRAGFDVPAGPTDAVRHDRMFDAVLAALMLALAAALTAFNRRQWLPARPPRRGA
jgi:hypothetical protein